jgi:hypothetical protein
MANGCEILCFSKRIFFETFTPLRTQKHRRADKSVILRCHDLRRRVYQFLDGESVRDAAWPKNYEA